MSAVEGRINAAVEIIAPIGSRLRSLVWVFGGMAVVGAVLIVLARQPAGASPAASRPFAYGVVMLVIGALGLGYTALFQAKSRLLVGPDQFGYQDALGRRHVWSAAQVGSIVDVTMAATRNVQSRRLVYFLGPDGRRLLMINPAPWPDSTVDRLARAAGKTAQARTTPISAAEFRREFPQAVSWTGRHGTLLGVALVVLIVAISAAITFVHW